MEVVMRKNIKLILSSFFLAILTVANAETSPTLIKPVTKNTSIPFTVWLKLRNKAQLDHFVRELYDPNSKQYRQFLRADDFNQHFAPTRDIEQKVLSYFIAQGMQASIVNHRIQA